jgi:hypothetical protein
MQKDTKPEPKTTELSVEDLEQVAGGAAQAAPIKIQKDKMQSANKNAEAVRGSL